MNTLVLIDGNSLMYRAYYATAYSGNLMKTSTGIFTNALYGFVNMMNKVMDEYNHTHMLVAFDAGKTTFRHEFLESYKDGRKPMPDEMRSQINLIKKYLDLLGVKRLELPTYEADDIIGTLAKMGEATDFEKIHIITGDKDLLQMVDEKTTVHITRKGVTDIESFNKEEVFAKYELTPSQIVDLKGLMGDPSDNLPGIPGVGEKTAIKLLKQFGTVENLIEHTDELKGKMKEKVETHTEQALLCKRMATIHKDVPLPLTFDDLVYHGAQTTELMEFFKEMEFNAFLKKMKIEEGKDKEPKAPVRIISEAKELETLSYVNSAIHVEIFEENYHQGTILGIAVVNEKESYYVPFEVAKESQVFMSFLSNEEIKKSVFDVKRSRVALMWQGFDLRGVEFDLLLATYVINPTNVSNEIKKVALHYDYDDVSYDEEVYGKGAKRATAPIEKVAEHSIDIATAVMKLKETALEQLKEQEQLSLFKEMEMPLAEVLAMMEYTGMALDLKTLDEMGQNLKGRIEALEAKIYEQAGMAFNINSPKQLGEVLFEKLSLPVIKKTKTGYSTNVDVLEKLMGTHPIIECIMEYRTLTKLYSTYIEGLKKACYEDGKVHTIFNQALTQTGRLSSIEPNLQNIPIRLEEGRMIRRAFVPSEEGWIILGADYSQIELRILAHISNTESLIEAFRQGEDIHKKTAMDVFKVSEEEMTSDLRRSAKAINFGIIYGMSAFGLSENLNITQKEAKKYIDHYLETYSGIHQYMEDTVKYAKYNGYVSTLFKRRRYIPELTQKNYAIRQFGERTAMNAPIQGTAADIIKKAMIDVYQAMQEKEVKSRLLLQVHDELIFEVPKEELETMIELVTKTMEDVVELQVPLKADYSYGPTWYDAK
ncbi:DNA polymerase I [Turicibacter sp. TJ11]|uniref:DNA polymerase I n=1 Tax=Turicibacter sp. TJ11 TaxID=2806443 RepID=UPI001F17DCC7|nr:DNA polymerase I [Turicibacter sp. TJ11]